jgi:hypothetical protein
MSKLTLFVVSGKIDRVGRLLGSVEPWKVKMTCAQQLDVRTPASSPRCPDTSRPTH